MPGAIGRLPDRQLDVLLDGYRKETAKRRFMGVLSLLIFVGCAILAAWIVDANVPMLINRIGVFTSYFDRILKLDSGARVWTDPVDWFWGLKSWLGLLFETLLIAYIGTAVGALLAFAACFFASANMTPARWMQFVTRRFLEICRTVPEMVFALVFVVAFGLGPLPGVLAIAIHTLGALGKMFAEIVENIDMKPVDGLTSSGAGWVQKIRFGALPQVLAGFTSYSLLRFEINVRGAAVMGFVGAGGIGQELIVAIRKFYYADVSALLVLLILTVFVIDTSTDRLRQAILGREIRS